MSLDSNDFLQIRQLMKEVLDTRLVPIENEIKALRSDIREMYDMIAVLTKRVDAIDITSSDFAKLSDSEQIIYAYRLITDIAKRKGIKLPA